MQGLGVRCKCDQVLAKRSLLRRLLANLYNGNVYIWSTNDQVGTVAADKESGSSLQRSGGADSTSSAAAVAGQVIRGHRLARCGLSSFYSSCCTSPGGACGLSPVDNNHNDIQHTCDASFCIILCRERWVCIPEAGTLLLRQRRGRLYAVAGQLMCERPLLRSAHSQVRGAQAVGGVRRGRHVCARLQLQHHGQGQAV